MGGSLRMTRTFDICDYCQDTLQVLWAITVGRATFHMYSNLSELYILRETVDKMIKELEKIKEEKIKERTNQEKHLGKKSNV